MTNDVDLYLPMIPDMELTASKTAEAVGDFMGLEHGKIQEIKVALIEACINAIEHSGEGRLGINFEMGDDELTIVISDQGQGFDISQVKKDIDARRERGEKMRGWGMMIIEEMMDRVTFDTGDHGTTITMTKRR
jgi:serine/threonine-protein kinase RsbW